jgi:predicted enzyme related to lactoylglutathione lyase
MSPASKENVMANPFVHLELLTTDIKSFYSSLFDWKLEDQDMGNMTYTMVRVGNGVGGGMMKHPMPAA